MEGGSAAHRVRAITLCVVSYPARRESLFEEVVELLLRQATPDFVLERCQRPADVAFFAQRWVGRGRQIDRLDLIGHGGGGRFSLGDELLFASDGTGYEIAHALKGLLSARAELRLLGCRTATRAGVLSASGVRHDGARLLCELQQILGGGRRVLGTADYVSASQLAGRRRAELERALVCAPNAAALPAPESSPESEE